MSDLQFDLEVAKMEALKRDMARRLNEELFHDVVTRPYVPPTWRERVRRRWLRVMGYLSTLWRALQGDDPYEHEGDW